MVLPRALALHFVPAQWPIQARHSIPVQPSHAQQTVLPRVERSRASIPVSRTVAEVPKEERWDSASTISPPVWIAPRHWPVPLVRSGRDWISMPEVACARGRDPSAVDGEARDRSEVNRGESVLR